RINVKPERIAVRAVPQNMTLSQALNYYKIPQDRHEELAVINGMNLNDPINRGTYIKVIGS
ncbi:MAG: peptidase M48, partial [Cyclobacteriaceae bacterium]|nr:peptidase M48 [Cyclobacteriaceae bacterium]